MSKLAAAEVRDPRADVVPHRTPRAIPGSIVVCDIVDMLGANAHDAMATEATR